MPFRICAAALLLLTAFAPIGGLNAEETVIPSVPLLSTGTTVAGETLHYPTNGPARALMEAMDVPHFGADAGPQPVRILTVFIGAEGAPADVIPVKP
jgi:hypothetical protein